MTIPASPHMPPARALLVINQGSLSGGDDRSQLMESFRAHGLAIVETTDLAGLASAISRRARDIDCIIAGGGDGTMNAVAPTVINSALPLGILPMGTANDLARTLAIPTDIESAVKIIAQGIRHRIDLGKVNDRYFFNIANIGLGVHVMRNLSDEIKQRWKILSYARALIKAYRSVRSFKAEIQCDGKRFHVRSIQIAVGNGRHYGGGMTVKEDARIDDGSFSFYSVKPVRWWKLLKLALLLRTGKFDGVWQIDSGTGTCIEITTKKRMPVTADGEQITHTPARFTMCARAIEVFVPADYLRQQKEATDAVQR